MATMTQQEITEYYEMAEALAASTGHDLSCFETTRELQEIEDDEMVAQYMREAIAEGTFECNCETEDEIWFRDDAGKWFRTR